LGLTTLITIELQEHFYLLQSSWWAWTTDIETFQLISPECCLLEGMLESHWIVRHTSSILFSSHQIKFPVLTKTWNPANFNKAEASQ
jgi:hypothetical protein